MEDVRGYRELTYIAWHPSLNWVVVSGIGIRVWDVNTGTVVYTMEMDTSASIVDILSREVRWSPSGQLLAISMYNKLIMLNTITWSVEFENQQDIRGPILAWSPDEIALAVSNADAIRIIDAYTGALINVFSGNGDRILALEWHGNYIAATYELGFGSSGAWVNIWNLTTGVIDLAFQNDFVVLALAWTSDGSGIIYQDESGSLSIMLIPGASACDIVSNSVVSLTNSITIANLHGRPTLICLIENSTYTLTDQLPDITGDITIVGNGATLQREISAPQFRLLEVEATGVLTLNDLTLTGGNHSSAAEHCKMKAARWSSITSPSATIIRIRPAGRLTSSRRKVLRAA